ncbi:MAG: hypothetical protein ACREIA_08840 [Opitutaceae bacterium]
MSAETSEFRLEYGRIKCGSIDVSARIGETRLTANVSALRRGRPDNRCDPAESSGRPSWNNGSPCAVAEQLFDEDDLEGCSPAPGR